MFCLTDVTITLQVINALFKNVQYSTITTLNIFCIKVSVVR